MSAYLIVDDITGLAVNAIEWDGQAPYTEPGCSLVPVPDEPAGVWTGWTLDAGQWTPPAPSETEKEPT